MVSGGLGNSRPLADILLLLSSSNLAFFLPQNVATLSQWRVDIIVLKEQCITIALFVLR